MARKTRKEKLLSDTRNFYKFQSVSSSAKTYTPSQTTALQLNDLQKTFTLTILVLVLQVILFFSLKNHLVSIPGISY